MRVIQSFERRLQGAVGNTFARLFGGRVQPAEVADALQKEAAEHIQQQGAATIAPNHYRVRLGPTDRQGLGADEVSVASALSDMIREYLDEQGWQTFGDVAVSLEQSESLHTGQFRISSIVDPDVGRRSPQARSGVGRMTQQPGDSGRSEDRRDPRHPGGGQDPQHDQRSGDQGQQYAPPGYPGQYGPPDQGYPGPGYQGQGYQGPNPGYPPQPYDAPGYGQRVWDQQGQQWEQQWGQQPPHQGSAQQASAQQVSAQQGPPPGYPQQPYQQGQPQPGWDQGYQQGYPAQGYPAGPAVPAELRPELRAHRRRTAGNHRHPVHRRRFRPQPPTAARLQHHRSGPGRLIPAGRHLGVPPARRRVLRRAVRGAARSRLDQRHHRQWLVRPNLATRGRRRDPHRSFDGRVLQPVLSRQEAGQPRCPPSSSS